jgi:methyl-accepting chemotaxis protein
MFKNMKVGTQIIIASFFLVVVSVALTSLTALRSFSNFMRISTAEEARYSIEGIKNTIEDEMRNVRMFRDLLEESGELARLVHDRDSDGVYNLTKPLMDASGIDILVVAAADGEVLARPHDRERIGDNIGNNPDVKNALQGSKYDMFMSAASTKLGYYCGAPVRYNGEVVGMLRTALSLEDTSLVDQIKTLFGAEATVFADKTRINTTLTENGKRIVGTDASQQVIDQVLRKGEDYSGEMNILGTFYLTQYTPIRDPGSGEIKGMLFTGKSLGGMYSAIKSSITEVSVVAVAILLLAFALSFWQARRISKSLDVLRSGVDEFSKGDLTVELKIEGKGEFAQIGNSLRNMSIELNSVIQSVNGASDHITETAQRFSDLADETNASVEEFRANVDEMGTNLNALASAGEEVNASVEEVAAGAQATAERGTDIARQVNEALDAGQDGMNAVHNALSGIDGVAKNASEAAQSVQELGERTRQIQNFVAQIGGIADQTNLLALNAAIEAARAGDAGRGFAVVAEEVRKLAEDSNVAAKSIAELATTITGDLENVVQISLDNAKASQEARALSSKTEDIIRSMISYLKNISGSTQDLAAVSQEQAASSGEIAEAVQSIASKVAIAAEAGDQIRSGVVEVAEAAERIAQGAESLSNLAADLHGRLEFFKMEENVRANNVHANKSKQNGIKALPAAKVKLWNKSLETGIELIDEQHMELFRQIEILLDSGKAGRVNETLDFLEKYIAKHFSDEQDMHVKSKYPKAAKHKKYHEAYKVTFHDLKEKYIKEGPTMANNIAVNKTVIGWLKDHIMVQDKDFAAFYKEL